MATFHFTPPVSLALAACLTLSACSDFDFDLRGNGPNTSSAALRAVGERPTPDSRGIISYPSYQVAVANRGDTVASVAARIGTDANELARYNGIPTDVPLRQGEILALPNRVSEPTMPLTPGGGVTTTPLGGGTATGGNVDIASLAGGAIERAGSTSSPQPAAQVQTGPEPVRHKVVRGETAYSIARLYGVTPRALSDWNGLGADLTVREGQYLLIPATAGTAPAPTPAPGPDTAAPGQGSATPTPPSASQPLPEQDATPEAPVDTPASPNLAEEQTETSEGRLVYPVTGRIIRDYAKGRNEGIDIAAPAGTPVKAADAGTVAAITRDTEQVPIIVVRHEGNLLTVYANVDNIKVAKGDRVGRGQPIAEIRAADTPFLHFEVREGFESVDPTPFLE